MPSTTTERPHQEQQQRETHRDAASVDRSLVIRPASRDQMPLAADIIRSTAHWYRPLVSQSDMSEHEVGEKWIARNYELRDFFLGWNGGKAVGVLSTQDCGEEHLYVGYVYLLQDLTGLGFGRKLIRYAADRAKQLGKKKLCLISHPDADWAVKAYERYGFERTLDRREDVLAWKDGWLKEYYEEGFHLFEMEAPS